MTPVVCYVRRTREWAEGFAFSGRYRGEWRAAQTASLWDGTFRTSYVDFRRRLSDIQRENLSEVPFDSVVDQYDYTGGGRAVPTDDDDWFHPDVVATLRGCDHPAVYWDFVNYNQGHVVTQDSSRERIRFESNNYALLGGDVVCLRDHTVANRKLRGFHLGVCLSMHNRSLGSLSLLRGISRDELLRLYEVYRRPVTGAWPPYFNKYVGKMAEVYSDLRVK